MQNPFIQLQSYSTLCGNLIIILKNKAINKYRTLDHLTIETSMPFPEPIIREA